LELPVILSHQAVVRVTTPGTLTSTTLAFDLSFDNGASYVPAHKEDGSLYTITIATNKSYAIPPEVTRGATLGKIKLSGGTSEATTREFILAVGTN
jgi:hypothetical protein